MKKAIMLIDHQNFKCHFKLKGRGRYYLDDFIRFFEESFCLEEIYFFGSSNSGPSIVEKEIRDYCEDKANLPPRIEPVPCRSVRKWSKPDWENTADFEIYLKAAEITFSPIYKDINTIILVSSDKDFYPLCKQIKELARNVIVVPCESLQDDIEPTTVSRGYLDELGDLEPNVEVKPYDQIKKWVTSQTNFKNL